MKALPDRLCREPAVHHDALFGVMGVPLRFQTNSALLYSLAIDAFARFGPPTRQEPLLHMRLFLHHVNVSVPDAIWPVVTRAQGDYYFVNWGPASTVVSDMARGFSFGFLSPDAQQWPSLAREAFVQMPVYYTLTRHDYVPLRLGVLLWRRRYPLYLAAQPGTDVSLLMYACVRSGWCIVAEDTVRAVRTPRGWHFYGIPWWLHLSPEAAPLFPELERATAVPHVDGTWRLVLGTEEMWPGSTEPHAGPGPLVLVQGHPTARSDYDLMDAKELLASYAFFPSREEKGLLEQVREVAAYLAERGTYWFDLGRDVERAVTLLGELADRHYR